MKPNSTNSGGKNSPPLPTDSEPIPVNLQDLESAFRFTTTKQLKFQQWIFAIMSNRILNKGAIFFTRLFLTIKIYFPIRLTMYKIFCGGTSIEKCCGTIFSLDEQGVHTILDPSKESGDPATLNETVLEIIETIKAAKEDSRIAFAVFKVTGIAEKQLLEKVNRGDTLTEKDDLEYRIVEERVDAICKAAYDNRVKVLIDAEDYCFQNAIDALAEKMMERYNSSGICIVFNTVQLYRKDKLEYLKKLHSRFSSSGIKIGVKIVRGAYLDKENELAQKGGYETPMHATKEDTDRDFDGAIDYCIKNISDIHVMIGTHNESSVMVAVRLMRDFNISAGDDRVWFAQLLGMSDNISFNLGQAGFNTAKYVPYGEVKDTVPYLIRRAKENKSVTKESSRELKIRSNEIARRKKNK